MEDTFIIDEDDFNKVREQLEKAIQDVEEFKKGKHKDQLDGEVRYS